MKAYKIDSTARTITEMDMMEASSLEVAQHIVGGYIETAFELPNGDTFFCDEEGLFKGYEHAFYPGGAHQPFLGNGIVMGLNRKTGDSTDVKTDLETIKKMVTFLTREEIIDFVRNLERQD